MRTRNTRQQMQGPPRIPADLWPESTGEIVATFLKYDEIVLSLRDGTPDGTVIEPLRQSGATSRDHVDADRMFILASQGLEHRGQIAYIGQAVADEQDAGRFRNSRMRCCAKTCHEDGDRHVETREFHGNQNSSSSAAHR